MTVLRRGGRAVAAVLLGAGATAVLVGAPADAQPGRCAPGTGVTVVVDYGPLGGGTQTGCDPSGAGRPAAQVVAAAGFSLTFVNGQAFVCRIDGKPDGSQENCQQTPPENAYWGLFWSDGKSTSWKYSSVGVGGLSLPKGGSIGWRFEDGGARANPGLPPTQTPDQPSPSPSKSPRPSRSPQPTPSAVPQPAGTSPSPSASTPPSSSAPPAGGAATPRPPATSGPAAATPTPGGGGAGHGRGPSATPGHPAGPKAQHHDSSGTRRKRVVASADTTGTAVSDSGQQVLTAVATSSVVLLGAAVGVAGWRRRS
ncbi:MAG: hypothetical protein QOK15_3864 [Nocardioidaceae bacterium]|nr:hypothetical protein [Nocardioidaceae bacterium]